MFEVQSITNNTKMNMEIISISKNGEDPFMIDEQDILHDSSSDDKHMEELRTQIQQLSVGDQTTKEEMEVEVENICDEMAEMCISHSHSQVESSLLNGNMEVEKNVTPSGTYFVGFLNKFSYIVVFYRSE